MNHLFCLMGKSATGKDTLYQRLLGEPSLGLRRVVPYTTRPMRSGEQEGIEYHFTDVPQFYRLLESGKIIESRSYQTHMGEWIYFTADDGQINLDEGSFLLVGTLEAFGRLQDFFGRDQVIPLYIEVEDGERLERALSRERGQASPDYEEMCRRYLADTQDFSEQKLEQAGIRKRYENRDLESCLLRLCGDIREAGRGQEASESVREAGRGQEKYQNSRALSQR